ncbi:hypothetical protein FF38_08354 [Lucilia cuprina]|uniref:DUF4806 domain-containing protein n=1 Tax=Lucilia cuprina TaxID=7375 RepID=A0A0L0C115_LUCCU|nr:hypothetical protein FF38_08354 [Lucilia cuprina]
MESKNPTIKRYKFGENLIPHDNPNTSLCCKNWKKCHDEKFELLTGSNAEELSECNNKTNEANRESYTRCIIKGQLHKSLTEIFSVNLIVASNKNGVHGKLSLKNFKRFYDVLMDLIRANGEEYPEKGIRYAFKVRAIFVPNLMWIS